MIMNSSSPICLGISVTSGLQIISCWSYALFFCFLQLKSPRLRERFRPPFTLPPTIYPPACWILFLQDSFSGLWSYERGTAWPLRQRTALESPALAVNMRVGVISTTQAVHPVPWEMMPSLKLAASDFFLMIFSQSSPYLLSMISSIFLKVSTSASEYLSSLQNLEALSCVTKILSTSLDTSRPTYQGEYLHAHRKPQRWNCRFQCPIMILQSLTWSFATLSYYCSTLHLASSETEFQLRIFGLVTCLLGHRLSQVWTHDYQIIQCKERENLTISTLKKVMMTNFVKSNKTNNQQDLNKS